MSLIPVKFTSDLVREAARYFKKNHRNTIYSALLVMRSVPQDFENYGVAAAITLICEESRLGNYGTFMLDSIADDLEKAEAKEGYTPPEIGFVFDWAPATGKERKIPHYLAGGINWII